MNNDEELERQLKSMAQAELSSHEPKPRIQRALGTARNQTTYREGVGFLTALIWVFVAGIGLNFYRATRKNNQLKGELDTNNIPPHLPGEQENNP